jgi:uncharacterized membrane protein (UPF0127 family)
VPLLRIILLLAAVGCAPAGPDASPSPSAASPGLPTGTLTVRTGAAAVTLRVEIAETGQDRATGLMNRTTLPPDEGMVFLYDQPTGGSFWMKDTLIPLSIAFWDANGGIAAILDMEPCEADPCPLYDPEVTYVGAVEVNRGWFEDNGVRVGDSIELAR